MTERISLVGPLAILVVVGVVGACRFDLEAALPPGGDLQTEENRVDSLIASHAPKANAKLFATTDGRKITIRFPSAPDSLAQMGLMNKPDTAKVIAKDLTRLLLKSYEGFEKIDKVEVEFAQESERFFPSTTLVFDEEEFRRLGP